MTRRIKKVAVLGSGIMGAGIACHFANIGAEVLLMDIAPRELTPDEQAQGLALTHKSVRNRIVNNNLQTALRSKPSPIYKTEFANRISTGNFDDDMPRLSSCDWVIEVVVERMDVKKQVFEQVDKHRKKGALVTSNTSGLSVEEMMQGRSDDFQQNFCGTHFFNPPRYLKLFEIIPTSKTSPDVLAFLHDYAQRVLGKVAVEAKNTPAFIANRVGTFSIMHLFNSVKELGFTIPEIDELTGPAIGRPKSATFRTADVVGIDTLALVAKGIATTANDEATRWFALPEYIQTMLNNKWLGDKTKQGFYKKIEQGDKKIFMSLNFNTMQYEESPRVKFDALDKTKDVDDIRKRMHALINDGGRVGTFYRATFYPLFQFVSNRIPEIANDVYKIDDALNAGFGWKLGPFETWDALGVAETVKKMEAASLKPAAWIYDMLQSGATSFYKVEKGVRMFYHIPTKSYRPIPGRETLLSLDNLRATNVVWENKDSSIFDLGDGVLCFEIHSKMNTIGGGVLSGLMKAIDMAEEKYKALVIYNEGENFSAGANVGMIFMMAVEQEYDELDMAIKMFQRATMRMRYSSVPVVAAPHGLVLGGGCELCMHCDKVIAHAESYVGLVEFGVGVIPGGGGTKEFALRLSDEIEKGDVRSNAFQRRYLSVGQAKVSTSAYEAFDLGYLRPGIDEVIVSRERQLSYAKQSALLMVEKGYTQPSPRKDIKVLGREALGLVYVGADSFTVGGYMSQHDKLIAQKLGYVMAGGDLSDALTEVSEQYLLDLERKAFLELCSTRKTMERMQSLINKGKILRN